ncbi:dihydropteroate synthase [Marinactinospora thermotolerans DSM 45154]|uniref:Dihydropteroate synthase n=1 Tax=Marinactinospora thermotolerans DSM 45154 TaxID=1122192 RepID=A0A1T4SX51_9ACTN|nr:hypothetical protein [Marinactinospora thermotolerans]SKA32736.1 dihydropteroate synthase [Marinactinospora thermotolerans DSM 45154]
MVPPDATVDGAVDAGYRPTVARVRELAAGDRPVLVRCAPPGEAGPGREPGPAETIAAVVVYAWSGARVFATGHPREVGQALDMVASISGVRPPAVARRGLV